MEDSEIIELYFNRDEAAVTQTSAKYGRYCGAIAFRVLHSREDSEECVNDTWWKAWNSIPPERPRILSAFLGTITRNLALHRYEKQHAGKRGGGETAAALEELAEVLASGDVTEAEAILQTEGSELTELLNGFLGGLSPDARVIFLQRYWYMEPVKEIAAGLGVSEGSSSSFAENFRRKLPGNRKLETGRSNGQAGMCRIVRPPVPGRRQKAARSMRRIKTITFNPVTARSRRRFGC